MKWMVAYSPEEARQATSALGERVVGSGAQAVAARIASKLHEASRRSFVAKAEPIHGAAWAPPSEATKRDRGFRSLLQRTGQLERAVVSGFGPTPTGAIAFVNVEATQIRKALIHLHGVTARKSRGYTRSRTGRTETRRRKRAYQQMPARGFVGLPPSEIANLAEYAAKVMVP